MNSDEPASTRRSLRRWGRLLVVAGVLAMASPRGGAQGPGNVRRVSLEGDAAVAPDQRIGAYPIEDATRDWRVDAPQQMVAELQGRSLLLLSGEGPRTVLIPLAADQDPAFNDVQVVIHCSVPERLRTRFASGARTLGFSRWVTVAGSADLQSVTLSPLAPLEPSAPVTAIEVQFAGQSPHSGLHGVELNRISWTRSLAAEAGTLAEIAIGGEVRPGYAIPDGATLRGTLPPPGGGLLELALGTLPSIPRARQVVQLEVRIGSERRSLELAEADLGRWSTLRWPLPMFSAPTEIQVTLRGAAAAAVSQPLQIQPVPSPSTIVLITSDTHRGDHLGSAEGGAAVQTPHLDALAARGTTFERCLATINTTIPSHCSILTGLHPRDTGVWDNFHRLGEEAETLAETLGRAGYHTLAAVSVAHLAPSQSGLGQGFDRFFQPPLQSGGIPAAETLAVTLRWLDEVADRPTFLWLHLFDAHTPYEPPPGYRELYYPDSQDPYSGDRPALDLPESSARLFPGLTDLEFPEALYRGEVTYLDAQLGRLLALPRMASAWIAFTGDHGENFGSHEFYWDHSRIYPATVHVPLILAGPQIPAGHRIDRTASNADVARTLLDLSGHASLPFTGRNLMSGEVDPAAFCLENSGRSASIATQDWYLILHLVATSGRLGERARHQCELYNLRGDPDCEHDQVLERPRVAASLRQRLIQFLRGAAPRGRSQGTTMDAATREALEALGYVDEVEVVDEPLLWTDPCACEWCLRLGLEGGDR